MHHYGQESTFKYSMTISLERSFLPTILLLMKTFFYENNSKERILPRSSSGDIETREFHFLEYRLSTLKGYSNVPSRIVIK